jgi:hypothetical protein
MATPIPRRMFALSTTVLLRVFDHPPIDLRVQAKTLSITVPRPVLSRCAVLQLRERMDTNITGNTVLLRFCAHPLSDLRVQAKALSIAVLRPILSRRTVLQCARSSSLCFTPAAYRTRTVYGYTVYSSLESRQNELSFVLTRGVCHEELKNPSDFPCQQKLTSVNANSAVII